MKIASTLFIISLIVVQSCATNAIKPEDRPLLLSVQLEPSKGQPAHIHYRGKGDSFLSRVNIGVGVGVGSFSRGGGVGAGVGVSKNLGREPSSEIDAVGMANKIDIDDIMMKKFKSKASEAGVVFVESAPKLKFTAHSTKLLFEGVMGNPTLTAEADFVLMEADRVVWRYTAQTEGSSEKIPSYSLDELLKKENLQTVMEKAAEILVDDAIKNLKKAASPS